MKIEVTGIIKGIAETILQVDEDLEYRAEYELRLKLDLDHKDFLTLKRMSLLGEPLCVTLQSAQMEFSQIVPEAFQEVLSTSCPVVSADTSTRPIAATLSTASRRTSRHAGHPVPNAPERGTGAGHRLRGRRNPE